MSDYISKKALLEHAQLIYKEHFDARNDGDFTDRYATTAVSDQFRNLILYVKSGRFDIPSDDQYIALKEEVGRYKEALAFYADPATYDIEHLDKFGYIIIDKDGGQKAREALSPSGEQQSGWYCKHCKESVPPQHVTYDERHDERYGGCGHLLAVSEEDGE